MVFPYGRFIDVALYFICTCALMGLFLDGAIADGGYLGTAIIAVSGCIATSRALLLCPRRVDVSVLDLRVDPIIVTRAAIGRCSFIGGWGRARAIPSAFGIATRGSAYPVG